VSKALSFGEEAALRKRERGAAASIQARVRGRAVRTGAGDEGVPADDEAAGTGAEAGGFVDEGSTELEAAAMVIQAHMRGMHARGVPPADSAAVADESLAELEVAAEVLAGGSADEGSTELEAAAVVIQAHISGMHARGGPPAADESSAELEDAAVLIQSYARGRAVRTSLPTDSADAVTEKGAAAEAAELAELEAAAVLIQSYSRGLRSRAQVSKALSFGEEAALRKRERGAAASIQARVRGRAVRTGAGDEGNLADDEAVPADTSALELAATHVQAHARGMAARAAGTHEPAQAAEPDAGFAELDTAATLIQARARGRTARSTIGATEQVGERAR